MTYEMYLGIHLVIAAGMYLMFRRDIDNNGLPLSQRDHALVITACALWPLTIVVGFILVRVARAKSRNRGGK